MSGQGAAARGGDAALMRLLYGCGAMQGLALVTFPAASTIFVSASGFHLSSAEYGAMFVPQVALAILASAAGPALAKRIGLRGALLLGLGADFLSMALLAVSAFAIGGSWAFVILCAATGALGVGFGLTVMALNTLVESLAPQGADAAVLTLNALLGLGTALAPVLVAAFVAFGVWWALPLLTAAAAAALGAAVALSKLNVADAPAGAGTENSSASRFWLFAGAALLYGVVETLNGNWASLYLSSQRSVDAQSAAYALTAFWLMVTLGRVALAGLARWLPSKWTYIALPFFLAAAFQGVAHAGGAWSGAVAFGAAGLACSGILPLSLSLAGAEFPKRAATMSGELIAFYQIGYGIAAFGVGPLRERAGVEYATAFSLGSLPAAMLGILAWRIIRRGARHDS